MAGWYQAGTVTVTNGSPVVTGVGTDFVNNVTPRDAFALIGGTLNEIASIESSTQMTLARPWLGATGGGQAYVVVPTVGVYVDLALRALNMLVPFQAVVDGIGQGLIGGGTIAAPGIRFTADQDTGIARVGENQIALVAGGGSKLTATASYLICQAPFLPPASGNPAVAAFRNDAATSNLRLYTSFPGGTQVDINSGVNGVSNSGFEVRLNDVSRLVIDASGNFLIGATTGASHVITKSSLAEGGLIAQIDGGAGSGISGQFRRVNANTYNGGAPAALMLGNNTSNGRSATVGGTLNASGADYAEYMTKAAGCGTIAKGDVCGVNRDGLLVRTWSDAVKFVVKSTDPNLVGGDTWAASLPPEPISPGPAPSEPLAPAVSSATDTLVEPKREEGEDDLAFIRRMAAYLVNASAAVTAAAADGEARAAYQAAAAAYPAAKAKHDAAVTAYAADLAGWEKNLEIARQSVDRIAFSGQVPVNVDGDTLAACEAALADGVAVYLVAVARGAGIGVSAVREGDMTLPLYMRRIGAVWAIRDGRPWVDVQHG